MVAFRDLEISHLLYPTTFILTLCILLFTIILTMKLTSYLALALPALAAAQEQAFLEQFQQQAGHWWDRVQDFGKNLISQTVGATSAKVADANVHYLQSDSWKETLQHSGTARPYSPPEAWMVLITGGNRTCKGRCERLNRAFNVRSLICSCRAWS